MKIILTIFILTGLFGCLEHAPMKTGFEGKRLPSFTFLLPDSTNRIYTDSLKVDRSFAIFYFSPDCPYCKAQIRDIIKHNKQLRSNKFLLITNYSASEVQKIIKELKLNEYKNMEVAIDNKSDYLEYYFIPNVPYLAIYDKEKKLKQVMVGKTDFGTIEKSLATN